MTTTQPNITRTSIFVTIDRGLITTVLNVLRQNAEERGLQSQGELADALSEAMTLPKDIEERLESLRKALRSKEIHFDHDAEEKWAEQEKHFNCPMCGGSGHVDDVHHDFKSVIDQQRAVIAGLADVAKLALKAILDEAEARDFNPPANPVLVVELEAAIASAAT